MFKNMVIEYVIQNKKIVLGLIMCILIGVISGFVIYNLSGKEVKDILVNQMSESIKGLDKEEAIKTEVIYNGIKNNIGIIFLMFLFSIMLYGTIFIYLIYIFKGISIGIYISTIFGMFGLWWGLLVVLILVVLVNIVYVPAIIFIGSTFINYNLNVLEYRREVKKVESLSALAFKVIFGTMIVFSSIIMEQLLSNFAIKIYSYIQK